MIPLYIIPDEYLDREWVARFKSEYHNGRIVAMAGAQPEHNALVFDLTTVLGAQLRGGPCQGFVSDQLQRFRENLQ